MPEGNIMRGVLRLASFCALSVTLAACNGGARTGLPPSSAGAQGSKQIATFTIVVPAKSTAARAGRRPAYISPGTQSIAISVYNSTDTTLITTANQNITTGAPGCTTPTPISSLTCAITIALSAGSYSFDLTTYDGLLNGSGDPTGNQLSADLDVPFTIVEGTANNIGVTLGGLPASVVLAPGATATLLGNNSAGYSLSSCVNTQSVSVFGVDADGNYILGTGAPTVSLSSSNTNDLSVVAVGSSNPNGFTLSCPSSVPWNVSLTLIASAAPASGSGGTTQMANIGVTFYHAIAGTLSEYTIPTSNTGPNGIATGADGALWFAEGCTNQIGRITTTGTVSQHDVLTSGAAPFGITAGPDGALWFTEFLANKIGRLTTSGSFTEYTVPTSNSEPEEITTGPDGALWFTEYNGDKIGRITTSGSFTEYGVPTSASEPDGIAAGADGALWFTEFAGNKIGRITTAGVITEYDVPTSNSSPQGIAALPDASLWFTESAANKIGRVVPGGSFTEYTIPTSNAGPAGITAGPDGALWFAEEEAGAIGRVNTSGQFSQYTIPTSNSSPIGITAGPNGAVWFTEECAGKIGEIQ